MRTGRISVRCMYSNRYEFKQGKDGYLDILVGAGTSKVHLFEGVVFTGDMEPDGDVDLSDFTAFALWWLDDDCGSKDDCGGADFGGDGTF